MCGLSLCILLYCHLEAVVGPAAKLHGAVLVVEGEPGDVDGAGGEEDAGGDVGAEAVGGDHHIGWVGPVKSLAGTENPTSTFNLLVGFSWFHLLYISMSGFHSCPGGTCQPP